jgi:hypothetical protein
MVVVVVRELDHSLPQVVQAPQDKVITAVAVALEA